MQPQLRVQGQSIIDAAASVSHGQEPPQGWGRGAVPRHFQLSECAEEAKLKLSSHPEHSSGLQTPM